MKLLTYSVAALVVTFTLAASFGTSAYLKAHPSVREYHGYMMTEHDIRVHDQGYEEGLINGRSEFAPKPPLVIGDTNGVPKATNYFLYNESWERPEIVVHKDYYKGEKALIWVETRRTVRLNQYQEGTNTITEIRFDQ